MKDSFAALGFGPELLAELTALGYEEPTPIQKAAAAPLLEGKDLLGQAATGTGKTAAFALLPRRGADAGLRVRPDGCRRRRRQPDKRSASSSTLRGRVALRR
jgi:hypothetical protein